MRPRIRQAINENAAIGLSRRARASFASPWSGRRRAGFTLAELLVILSIVTILVAILVPVFVVARNRAHGNLCLNNLRSLGQSAILYADDHDDTLPEAPGTAHKGSVNPNDIPNIGILSYTELRTLFPSQSSFIWGQLSQHDRRLTRGIFRCPNDRGAAEFGYDGPVADSALTSYLWDPGSPANSPTGAVAPASVSVNGVSLSALDNPSQARLLQDYGLLWHASLSGGIRTEGRSEVRYKQGLVNVVYADGRTAHLHTTAREVISMRPAEPASPGGGAVSTAAPVQAAPAR